jgi:hypothetical protein
VIFTGLPGTGKSLLVHQLAHVASAAGRTVHLLQWDVARPVFEASPAGRRYPLRGGVTHVVIRKAAGLWARRAVVDWARRHPDPRHLLVGEAPFVGGRFVELARRVEDEAEPLLAAPSCRFALAVPSAPVRGFLESLRERRAARPLHPREREDAPPQVLRDLWRELAVVATRLGLAAAPGADASSAPGELPYDPAVYRRVYEAILRHRHRDVVPIDVVLPTAQLSVYDFAEQLPDVVPTHDDAERSIREVERRYGDASALDDEIARWWEV